MNFLGKLTGLMIGVAFFHHPLAIAICVALGHIWDRSVGSMRAPVGAAPLSFIEPLFGMAGAIAKSDGRVSEQEIAATEQLMARMALSSELRAAAIAQFNAGKQPGYVTMNAIGQLRIWCAGRRDRAFLLTDLLLDIVCAEGPLAPAKLALVRQLCASLGLDERQLAALAAMKGYAYAAPERWQQYTNAHTAPPRSTPVGKDPYAVLGIERSSGAGEIKRAYRKLISQHHPDKLGDVPDELKRRAEERAREINAAYDKIQDERGFK
ncbi:MAG TPA: co-chaperone DjlA [Rudaea sp.]|jgi:DnaJ like chaperone protein|uniref:co-chaperone DjlA n=1 Tax=Rudaea sp. TaxID=2136325 RepID=UPI002F95F955